MKRVLDNIGDAYTSKHNANIRYMATPSPSYSLFDGLDLIEDQLLHWIIDITCTLFCIKQKVSVIQRR